jgi:uncharacterized protein YcfJ
MKRHTAVLVTGVIVTVIGLQPVCSHAGAFDGALGGAILGNMVGGRKAARKGAIIGGVIGATNSIANDQQQRRQQAEAEQRRAEWEAQQRAEQARIEQRMAAATPPAAVADQTLIVETQKSLIRMGYDPGRLGQAGPELTAAVLQYQRNKGLLETGELSQALLTHMLRNGG